MGKISTKFLLLPLFGAVLTVGFVAFGLNAKNAVADDNGLDPIVGVWEVTADAPYAPHLFTFNADGTMLSTNPTNVQERPTADHGGTNDSVGMGTWKVQVANGTKYYVGTFEELNAFADNHQPTDTLFVSFKVTVNNGVLDGPAQAKLGSFTVPSHLHGTLTGIDQAAVDSL